MGTFLRSDPELIARLHPDLVIVHKLPNELTDRLAALHIVFAGVDRGNLEDSYTEIRQIGEAAGVKAQAEQLIAKLRACLGEIHAQAKLGKAPSVIIVIGRKPGTLSNLVVVGWSEHLSKSWQRSMMS